MSSLDFRCAKCSSGPPGTMGLIQTMCMHVLASGTAAGLTGTRSNLTSPISLEAIEDGLLWVTTTNRFLAATMVISKSLVWIICHRHSYHVFAKSIYRWHRSWDRLLSSSMGSTFRFPELRGHQEMADFWPTRWRQSSHNCSLFKWRSDIVGLRYQSLE